MRIWQLLFLFSLAALPVQLGKFFFIKDSYVLGLPIDYLAISIYFSDLVIIALIVSYLWSLKKSWKKIFNQYRFFIIPSTIFSLYLFALTILTSPSPTSFFFCIKVAVLFIYSLIAADFFSRPYLAAKAKNVINFSLIWVSLLILLESALQRSLNLWLLGERAFDTSTANIAHFSLFGQQLLRSYATFPHPNVAGAFIVIYMILSAALGKNITTFQKVAVYPLSIIALLLTFGKTALFALTIYALLVVASTKTRLSIIVSVVTGVLFLVGQQRFLPIASIAERLSLMQAALDISLNNPIFGVGPTNFIRALATLDLYSISQTRLLQPVHNIFLIFLAETGVVGLLLFYLVLFTVASQATTVKKQALFIILLLFGSIDHFLITLHQGQLLFWLALGYILSKDKVGAKKLGQKIG